jgi:hypothetical protein
MVSPKPGIGSFPQLIARALQLGFEVDGASRMYRASTGAVHITDIADVCTDCAPGGKPMDELGQEVRDILVSRATIKAPPAKKSKRERAPPPHPGLAYHTWTLGAAAGSTSHHHAHYSKRATLPDFAAVQLQDAIGQRIEASNPCTRLVNSTLEASAVAKREVVKQQCAETLAARELVLMGMGGGLGGGSERAGGGAREG